MPEQLKNNVVESKITSALGIAAMIFGIIGANNDPEVTAQVTTWITVNTGTIAAIVVGIIGLIAKEK